MKYYFLALGTVVAVCVGCASETANIFDRGEYVAPPAGMVANRGPGVDGPGPGVRLLPYQPMPPMGPQIARVTQVRFTDPVGMRIGWQVGNSFADNQLVVPAKYNFPQAATYRLKLSEITDRPGEVIYPTLQVFPSSAATDAYLTHAPLPIEITLKDLEQVAANNMVTKVIYLPDPRHQGLAVAGVSTLVSTQLPPGADPVSEAERLGTIMAVLKMGSIDYEMPNAFGGGQPQAFMTPDGKIQQVQAEVPDGAKGQYVPPMPIAAQGAGQGMFGIPGRVLAGGPTAPGMPPMHPIAGMGPIPPYGMPYVGTPLGLPGPTHLPLGQRASLRSYTVRNLSKTDLPEPTRDFLLDVKHDPPLRLPEPVRHVQYSESHPVHLNGETSWPRWSGQ